MGTIAKIFANKIATAILAIGTIGAGIYFWRNPDDLAAIWHTVKYVLIWAGFVAILPPATFFVTIWAVRRDSNRAGAFMLGGYLLADIVMAFVLAGGIQGHSTFTWMCLLFGFLAAAVYNYAVCDYLAARIEEQ